jgi:hypothetical protein
VKGPVVTNTNHFAIMTYAKACTIRPTTPTRASARVLKAPTWSISKLAHVRQQRTTVVNPA